MVTTGIRDLRTSDIFIIAVALGPTIKLPSRDQNTCSVSEKVCA